MTTKWDDYDYDYDDYEYDDDYDDYNDYDDNFVTIIYGSCNGVRPCGG